MGREPAARRRERAGNPLRGPGPLLFGILNVTPDSFSDGGDYFDPETAARRGEVLLAEGADVVDVGGESTRPGSDPVPEEEELRRVVPVVGKILEARPEAVVSVDTYRARTAEDALEAGARIVNDVTALRGDPRMAPLVADAGCPVVLMHMLGEPKTMQREPRYEDVVREAAEMGASGTREIVVTGVCVGAYGPDTGSGGPDLAQILLRIADQPGVARVRLSSIQPIEVTPALIEAFASHPNLCPHLHLSCQSGDDTVLRAMNRPYFTAFYKDLVRRLRDAVPDVAITTDLIVGYPGETRAQHENTLRFAEEVGFQRTHVFRYSPRPRTHAEQLPDDVPPDEKVCRHKELQAVVDETNAAFTARYLGQTLPVLVEGREGAGGLVGGHTTNYIKVVFPAPRELTNQIVPVRLVSVTEEGARGELALPASELAARVAAAPRPAPEFVPLAMA